MGRRNVSVRTRATQAAVKIGPVATIVLILALLPAMLSATSLLNVQSAIGLALFACATNLLIGYGGLVSFGQGAFYGIGAYVVALMSPASHASTCTKIKWRFWSWAMKLNMTSH